MLTKDLLKIEIFETRKKMGLAAAVNVAACVRKLLKEQDTVRMIFAAAPSQNEFLQALTEEEDVDWGRVEAFHMDEYLGLPADAPQGFGNFLKTRLFSLLPFQNVHYIGSSGAAEALCQKYEALLRRAPVDIVCMGVGENGHIAFNDPPADFHDRRLVKPVQLDDICRRQQVHDGCFADIKSVPKTAVTLTVPALMSGRFLFCIVPGAAKAAAVKRMLDGEISKDCPATALRLHDNAALYLDTDSSVNVRR